MKPIYSIIFITLIAALVSYQEKPQETGTDRYRTLKEGFQNPPNTARPKVYWWWLNGYTDTTRMKQELRAMKQAGISGADIFEIGTTRYSNPDSIVPAGPPFMSEKSLQAIQFAIEEATQLDITVGLNLASSWNAGGPWVQPKHAAKSLYFSKTSVAGPGLRTVDLPFPEIAQTDQQGKPRLIEFADDGKPVYHEEVAVLAIPANKTSLTDTSGIVQLSSRFNPATEQLEWEVPEGEWDIYRYVCANSGEALKLPSPNAMAPIIDHYDSAATRAHFMYFINHLQPRLGDFGNTALKNFYLASYEATGSVWTPSLPETFEQLHGYSVHKFIPALFDEQFLTPETAERFRQDFNKTLSHLIINNHYGKAKEICHAYGLQIISESGGPGEPLHNVPVDALKALGTLDVPRGEFWNKHYYYAEDSVDVLWLVKEVAAASHIYQRGIVEEESFTSFQHWQDGPFDLKPLANRAFGEGMNRVVVHGFTHNPPGMGYPGIVYHAGTHYNDKRVWWPKVKPFNDYLARISYLWQETDFVADVVYYYGDRVPNFVAPKNTRFSVGPGYDYEIINTDVLLNDLRVEDGQLVLSNGARFKVLSLGENTTVNPAVIEKLGQLAQRGAVIVSAKPKEAIGLSHQPQATQQVKSLADSLWKRASADSENQLRKGGIFSGISAVDVLRTLQTPPDFHYADQQSGVLDFVHYQDQALDFYLVSNTSDAWVTRACTFRQTDKTPEIWDPVTGHAVAAGIYQQNDQGIQLPVSLPPYGACLVAFRPGAEAFHYETVAASGPHPPRLQYVDDGINFLEEGTFALSRDGITTRIENPLKTQPLEGAWQVRFPKNWGAPDSAEFPKLISWTDAQDQGIRYFSGTATYYTTFSFSLEDTAGYSSIALDLGKLSEIAEVWLNNESLGISWSEPHAFDVTDVLREGENTLTIEVANTWSNRLVGDAHTGENYTKTNISTAYRGTTWEEAPLLESGLLGPVTLRFTNMIRL